MRGFLSTGLLLSMVSLSARAGDEPVRINDELTIRNVAPQTYVVVHEKPFAANSVVAKMPDGTLLIIGSRMIRLRRKLWSTGYASISRMLRWC